MTDSSGFSASRTPIIGANWKMNTTLPEAVELAGAVARGLQDVSGVEVVLCPPFPQLHAVHQVIEAGTLQLGAQDMYWEARGAFTGEVSGAMLTAVGCWWVIVGHSERRTFFGETDESVNRKLRAALDQDLQAIVCIGETGKQRHAGETEVVLEQQLRGSLNGMDAERMRQVVIAYEPVWAIGTGETATPEQARQAHEFVRGIVRDLFGHSTADEVRIQYGGSVTAANAAELMAQPGIDGALVGGASLKADDFAAIVRAAARVNSPYGA